MPAIKKCRLCQSSKLIPYLDLGFHPHSDRFLSEEQMEQPETYYPLKVLLCENCGISQLSYTVEPKVLYQEEYPYETSNRGLSATHYRSFAESVVERFNLSKKDLAVDIGSNIGTLLQGFQKAGTRILGVDPAKNIAALARKQGVPTIADFFTPKIARQISRKYGPARVIVGTNVFAHIYNHTEFMSALKTLLSPNGVFIFESPHFLHLVENLEYDTIYLEHLLYLSLKPVVKLMDKFGFQVFRVEEYPIHGGSFRVFIARKGQYEIDASVKNMLKVEKFSGIHDLEQLEIFAQKVADHRVALNTLITRLLRKKKLIAIVSTPAKGMTLLNYCHIGPEHVVFATERLPHKIGRFTPGTHIPILPDSELLRQKPDYAILLAWNFAEDIIKNLAAYQKRGGKFIIPIPWPKIV